LEVRGWDWARTRKGMRRERGTHWNVFVVLGIFAVAFIPTLGLVIGFDEARPGG